MGLKKKSVGKLVSQLIIDGFLNLTKNLEIQVFQSSKPLQLQQPKQELQTFLSKYF